MPIAFSHFLATIDLTADNKPFYRVYFDSSGGVVDEAMEVGRKIRVIRVRTEVRHGARCSGACTLAFLGGTRNPTFDDHGRPTEAA